jgi:hypothetical protein
MERRTVVKGISEEEARRLTSDSFLAAVYWGARPETAAGAAERFLGTVTELEATGDPLFTGWSIVKGRKAVALPRDTEELAEFVATEVHRRDSDNSVMEDLGYEFNAYSGDEYDLRSATVSASCGTTSTEPPIPNNALITPSRFQDAGETLPLVADELLAALVDAWDPDWGMFTSYWRRKAQDPDRRSKGTDVPYVGVLTWLSDRLGSVPADIPAATVRRYDGGTLIDLRRDGELPDEEAVRATAGFLREAGTLAPIPVVQQAAASTGN